MPEQSKKNIFLDFIKQMLEAFLKNSAKGSGKRTWHQHVVPYKDGWAVKREGNKRNSSTHKTQEYAINKAKRVAKKYKADVIIHRSDGTIRDRMSYD